MEGNVTVENRNNYSIFYRIVHIKYLIKALRLALNWFLSPILRHQRVDRLRHWQEEVDPLLKQGVFVISDRYVLSSLVYQGQDCPEAWVRQINQYAAKPDVTILVSIEAERAYERVQSRGGVVEIYDEIEKQKSLAACYERLGAHEDVVVINGDQSMAQVAEEIQSAIMPLMES